MKRHEIIETILTPLLELSGIVGIFFVAYNLRQITDGIPGIQLPIPYISKEQFLPFVLSGTLFWGIIFSRSGLYRHTPERPLFDTIQSVIVQSGLWFIIYIGFVYLSTGFIFSKEIPRLIIGYVYILSTVFSILIRVGVYYITKLFYIRGYIQKNNVLIIGSRELGKGLIREEKISNYHYIDPDDIGEVEKYIRTGNMQRVLLLASIEDTKKAEIIKLCSIYAVAFAYPKILPEVYNISQKESFIGGLLVIESRALKIGAWGRIIKRTFDIVFSGSALVILFPLFLIIAICIKIEDSSGPVIFKNRRIGIGGKEFFLYKFRYMYWKYSVKDAYNIMGKSDAALKYEEELRRKSDTRNGPLYKIKDDPRKTRVGAFIEKLSLDELPQLWNVFLGNMSLVGPRPHQPREVELYAEHHHQVLTVKPGITGMAQVFGRDKNTFEDEVRYDVYYIEHYSLLLDLLIISKTFFVVLLRAFK